MYSWTGKARRSVMPTLKLKTLQLLALFLEARLSLQALRVKKRGAAYSVEEGGLVVLL